MASMVLTVAWVASSGGVDGFDGVDGGLVASMASMVALGRRWRRMVASNGGGLGSSTQRALTWKSLCVPSGEDDTHSSGWFFVFSECRMSVAFVFCSGTVCFVFLA